jgi:acetyltransferase-like isoleucine patch superfamily enzyme
LEWKWNRIMLKKIIIGLAKISPNPFFMRLLARMDRVEYARLIGVTIGQNCAIYKPVSFGSEPYLITLGNHVSVGREARFITHDGAVWVLREKPEYRNIDRFNTITVGDNVFIGDRVILMPGIKIGNNVIIGAGALVTRDIPDNSVAVGVPARVIKTISDYERNAIGECVHTASMGPDEKRKFLLAWKKESRR